MKKEDKKGLIGKLDEDNPFVIYCNEKDKKRGKFLFKCCKGCKHNPFSICTKCGEEIKSDENSICGKCI